MSFNNYAQQQISQQPIPVALPQVRGPKGPAVLHVLHAGDGNDEYMKELASSAVEEAKILKAIREAKSDAERAELEAAREHNLRARYIRTIVKGIDNVFHDNGTPATADDIPEFVHAMPSHAFWALVAFCRESTNFIDVPSWPDAAAAAEK